MDSPPSLQSLLDNIWFWLKDSERWDKKGNCEMPGEWKDVKRKIDQLVKFRDCLSHANYTETMNLLHQHNNLAILAVELYNGFISEGTGYYEDTLDALRKRFSDLKLACTHSSS
jgi:hypothetical protein